MNYYLQLKFFLSVILVIFIIIIDSKFNSFLMIRKYLETSISPLYFLIDLPRKSLDNLYEMFISNKKLKLENKILRQKIFIQNAQLLRLQNYKYENFRLRKLLNSPLFTDEQKILTQVISFNKTSYSDQLIIDKGNNHGIYEGQVVVNDKAIIGQVISVGKITSRILLICDISHAIPLQVLRNNIRMIVYGRGCSKDLKLENMSLDTDIRIGDLLITSGLGGKFPEGYPVALISSVRIDNKLSSKIITAKPIANMNYLNYLLLLKKINYKENSKPVNKVNKIANKSLLKITNK